MTLRPSSILSNYATLLGMAILPDSGAYHLAVALDRPEMLDEFIRRSGVGIPIPSDAEKDSGAESKVSDEDASTSDSK